MSARSAAWLAAVVVIVALGGALWWLAADAPRPDAGPPLDRVPPADLGLGDAPRPLPEAPDAAPLDAPAPPTARAPDDADTAARVLHGRVLRLADGSPVAGWRLRFPRRVTSTGGGMQGLAVASTTLDAQGRFRFDDARPDAEVLVLESVDALAPQSVLLELPAEPFDRELELLADTGWILEGLVRSEAGAALLDAQVVAQGHAPADLAPDGRFRLLDVRPPEELIGALVLQARAELHGIREKQLLLDDDRRVLRDLEFVLPASGAVEGRVIGPDGLAHPWARITLPVRLHPGDVELVQPRLEAGAPPDPFFARGAGRVPGETPDAAAVDAHELPVHYRIDSVPPGRYALRVEPPALTGLEGATLTADDELVASDDERALLAPPEQWLREVRVEPGVVTRVDLSLSWGAGVAGRLVDEAGAGLAGLPVRAVLRLEWELPGAQDAFEVAQAGGFELRKVSYPEGGGAEALELELARTESGPDGGFVLGRLPPGAVRLEAGRAGGGTVERELQLEAGVVTRGLALQVGGGLAIAGRVLGPDGLPVEGAWVALGDAGVAALLDRDARRPVDDDGSFRFDGLRAGEYRVSHGAPGHHVDSVDVAAGGAPLALRLERAPVLRGTVVDAVTGTPVRLFELRVTSGNAAMATTVQHPDGAFEVPAPQAGPATLRIEAAGYRAWERAGLLPALDDAATPVDVRLEPEG